MGLAPLWRLRDGGTEDVSEPAATSGVAPSAAMPRPPRLEASASRASTPPIVAPAAPSASRPATQLRQGREEAAAARPAAPLSDARQAENPDMRARRIATLDWDALEADIHACRQCVLGSGRTQAVPGVGDREARWMLVGEGPGKEEDRKGEPFVGQAGRLLDNMLGSIGLRRGEDVYIANTVKCRPPHNRTPEAAEIGACLPYLERQIELVRPQILIALGRPAAQALLGREIRIAAARGQRFAYRGISLVVTYHPAYLLRNPQDKARAWEDLCFARRLMAAGD
ncbi:MAG: uracil-DNA glycosylase [Thauera phenolivorans]|uniref:Type-4 uracil-DNA glycosylase n=1 Tax=Thauera phenolivorans TaxID=1792543 RepID=A0A7X7LXY3_9RHOO|nr:uracil-DNA glycosylase [Thauera phenolivorans]NLF55425.1 uracil-DNA glycosylase [Thauera phenolivorans]